MNWRQLVSIAVVVLLIPAGASAQAPPRTGESSVQWLGIVDAGYSRDDANAGLGLTLGAAKPWRRVRVGASLEAIFGTRQSDRYFVDTYMSPQGRCRDGNTGQFTSMSKCNTVRLTGAGFGTVEFTVSRAIPLVVGGGFRVGPTSQPVAVIGFETPLAHVAPGAHLRLSGVVGDGYASVRIGVMVPHGSEQ